MPELAEQPIPAAGAAGPGASRRRWILVGSFTAVMVLIAALTGLFIYGFFVKPRVVKSPLVHKPALDFSLTEMNTGEQATLVSLRGTPFLLNFWASWCVACKEEAHLLEAAYQKWGQDPKKFRVIGVAIQDTPKAAKAFAKRFGKTYFLALDDEAGDLSLNYGLYGVPETFFIDAKGIIRYKQIGPVTPEVLQEWIPKLMQEASQAN